jgi:3-mercaptopyruvate sulfurtransferase SseA
MSCGGGIMATMGFLAGQKIFKDLKVYDGSWSEYSQRSA